MKLKVTLILAFIFFTQNIFAQEDRESGRTEDLIQSILENVDGNLDFTDLFERFELLKRRPLDLNKATEKDLRDLIVLSDLQIANLIKHRQKFGPFISIYELQSLELFDLRTIYMILPYVKLGTNEDIAAGFLNAIKNGRHEVLARSRGVMNVQKGYTSMQRNSGSSYYPGDPFNHYVRYRFYGEDRLSISLVGEKDPGEQFFKGARKDGFDFYSGHISYKSKGFVRQIVLGDYSLQYGQGLNMWQGLGFGKTPFIFSVKRNGRGIVPYASVNEALFFRGAVTSFGYKAFTLHTFFSSNKIDAAINSSLDSLTEIEQVASSLLENGFHRTAAELEKRKTLDRTMYGFNLSYTSKNNFKASAIYHSTSFQTPITTGGKPYQLYNFSGKNVQVAGLEYSYIYKNVNLFGEVSHSIGNGSAIMQGALISLDKNLSIISLYRNFSKNYVNLFSNPIAESSNGINENGLYTGFQLNFNKRWALNGYTDQFNYPWLRYLVDAPSSGKEHLITLEHSPSRKTTFYLRYRIKSKPQNNLSELSNIDFPELVSKEYLRLNAAWSYEKFSFQSRAEFSKYNRPGTNLERGFLIFQDINFSALRGKLTFSTRFSIFETTSFNTAIYAYEKDVLYFFSVPPYYGKGMRNYFLVKYRAAKNLDVWFRIASTTYADQKTIGSGLDLITGNNRTDSRLQLRWRF